VLPEPPRLHAPIITYIWDFGHDDWFAGVVPTARWRAGSLRRSVRERAHEHRGDWEGKARGEVTHPRLAALALFARAAHHPPCPWRNRYKAR